MKGRKWSTEDKPTRPTHLVEGGGFALGIFHHSIPNIFVVYPVSECDSDGGGNSDAMPLCLWIVICEIAGNVHDGSAPAIETEDFICEIDNFPTLGIGELHSVSPRPRGDEFWTEFLVQLGLEGRELHLCICREVEERGVVGSAREGVLRVISSVHRRIERRLTVHGY